MILILTQIFTTFAATIEYNLSNSLIQQSAITLNLNITATFTTQDIKLEIKLPDQILNQNNIVCGITGLTSGSCNLLYSKFVVTFKSATTSFQVKFVNMQNPSTNYTDPVQVNCSEISSGTLLFTQNFTLKFTLLDLNAQISGPTTTY